MTDHLRLTNSYARIEERWRNERRRLIGSVASGKSRLANLESNYTQEKATNKKLREALLEKAAKSKGRPLTSDEEMELMGKILDG